LLLGFFIALLCFAHDAFLCAGAWNIQPIWSDFITGL
jgi:hypothetical protein